jgi:hypothetical protein
MLNGWKTLVVAVLTAVFGALESLDYTQFLTADNAGYVTAGLGVVMFILRTLTKTPILKSE